MNLCSICGTYHDAAGCPAGTPGLSMQPTFGTPPQGSATLNGMTPFELEMLEKMDKLIRAIGNLGICLRR